MNNTHPTKTNGHHLVHQMDRLQDLLCGLGFVALVVEYGYRLHLPAGLLHAYRVLDLSLLLVYLTNIVLHFIYSEKRQFHLRFQPPDLVVLLAILFFVMSVKTIAMVILARQLLLWLRFMSQFTLVRRFLNMLSAKPAPLILASFFSLILAGAILLMLPSATQDGQGATWLTALFTATSAACVTGLVVVDTGAYYSTFGQLIILGLIQAGGLGIMTLSTSLTLVLGRRMGIRERAALQDIFEVADVVNLRQTIVYIIKFTCWIEITGAIILYFKFRPYFASFYRTLFAAVFHSISAFCNAGFALFPDNLMRFQEDWIVCLTIGGLIVLGGLGFIVVANLITFQNLRRGVAYYFQQWSLHTKIAIIGTLLLIGVGSLLIFFFEFDNALNDLPVHSKLLAALFQSITLRTAGFNTIEMSYLRNSTIFIMIIWMFIGACPGSTGGGIKVSTLGVLFLTIRSILKKRPQVEAFHRTIPNEMVYKSLAVTLLAAGLLALFLSLLLTTEKSDLATLAFESTSAFGTVGLSLGITPYLSALGRICIIILMYIGRVGPLTLAYAIGERSKTANVRFPTDKVMVG
ncbi:TrkH family potassium uptake protein [candidate division KSB1 bacterium]|nr:TrkH family potassium uptake protein [candidate division KSB1 bacterium]